MIAKLILLTLFVGVAVEAFVCPPDFCSSYSCNADTTCADGRLEVKGGVCGCCDVCIKELNEGESCQMMLLLGHQRTHECKAGLRCDRSQIVCVRDEKIGECHKAILKIRNVPQRLGQFTPACDDFNGQFAAKQCHGSVCYCAKANGEKIQGYDTPIGDAATQTCKCARNKAEYHATGLIGKMFSCENNGNYEKVQCRGSVCFCADSDGKEILGVEKKHISNKMELSCLN